MSSYTGLLLRVDLDERTAKREPVPETIQRKFLGGRGFGIHYLFHELSPGAEPFSLENKLFIGVGPLCGTAAQGCSKFVVMTKSPESGGIIRSVSGAHFGAFLKFAGFDLLIVEGQSRTPCYIYLDGQDAHIMDAGDLWGLDTEETQKALQREHGATVEVACIGPAGERLVRYAAIVNKRRTASRGGVGAVMGSKRLKAIVIGGKRQIPKPHNHRVFKELNGKYLEILRTHPRRMLLTKSGTMGAFRRFAQELYMTPCRNFTQGPMEGLERLVDDEWNKLKVKSFACYGCMTKCGQVRKIEEGPYAGTWTEGPEYETTFAFGPNLYNVDIGSVMAADSLCDLYGMDTISAGVSIGFAYECFERGLLRRYDTDGLELTWGDPATFLALVHKIGRREGFGKLLGEGVKRAADLIGKGSEAYAMHVKGVELPGYEPRAVKAYALSYAVSNIGGSHMYGRPHPDLGKGGAPLEDEGKGRMVLEAQIKQAIDDSVILCGFGNSGLSDEMRNQLLAAATGFDEFAENEVMDKLGERIVCLERVFNVRDGFSRKDDILPSRFLKEPLKDAGPATGEMVRKFDLLLDEYYDAAGYTRKGTPTFQKLEDLELKDVIQDKGRF